METAVGVLIKKTVVGNTKFGLYYWLLLLLRRYNAGNSIRYKKMPTWGRYDLGRHCFANLNFEFFRGLELCVVCQNVPAEN
jgi:hypothetical protein